MWAFLNTCTEFHIKKAETLSAEDILQWKVRFLPQWFDLERVCFHCYELWTKLKEFEIAKESSQIPLLILSKFKQINELLFPRKSSKNLPFSGNFSGNRSWLMRLNSLNISSKIRRKSLNDLNLKLSPWQPLIKEDNTFITLFTWLLCNLQTRHHFQIKFAETLVSYHEVFLMQQTSYCVRDLKKYKVLIFPEQNLVGRLKKEKMAGCKCIVVRLQPWENNNGNRRQQSTMPS